MKSASKYDIIHIAKLSKLSIDKKDLAYLTKQFSETIDEVNKLNKVNTKNTKETSNITSLKNVFRDDVIENDRILNQEECLSNAKNAYNGYFMVEAIFNEI